MKLSFLKYTLLVFLILTTIIPVISQETFTVNGRVTGIGNEPLFGISISVQGTKSFPVLTDENGTFSIDVPSGNEWLLISSLGKYKNKTVFINNRKEIEINLVPENLESGYDKINTVNKTKNRRDFISPVTTINMDDARYKDILTIDQVFQGNVPGLLSQHHSGMPGKGMTAFMRGINSMNSSNAPLIIVDGMPYERPDIFISHIEGNIYNPISTINPENISSVSILKGTGATARYGTKASNGVIYINTLEAQSTETTIDFSAKYGFNKFSSDLIPQLNDEQYKTMANEILSSSSLEEEGYSSWYPGLYATPGDEMYYRYMHNTNWQKLVFSDSRFTEANLTVKGGSNIAKYGLFVGYHDEGGIFKNTSYDRLNVRFVSDLTVFSWLKMDVNASLTNVNSQMKESAISSQTSPVLTSLLKPPIMNPYEYNDEGQELTTLDNVDGLGISNPQAIIKNFKGENNNTRFVTSINGRADISESLNWNTFFGLNVNTLEESVYKPNIGMEAYLNGEAYNISQAINNQLFTFYTDNYLNFNKIYNSIHELGILTGFRIQVNSFQADFGEAKNLYSDDEYTDLDAGQDDLERIGGNNSKWNWLSAYNQVNYTLKDKYLFNTVLCADFSTLTGKEAETDFTLMNMPFGIFYSVGAGWRLSNEGFLKNVNILENLLLRISYGKTGNDDVGTFNSLNYYEITKYRETSGLIPGEISNKSLRYEKMNELNTGLDISLFSDKTRFAFDYYLSTTENMVIYEPQESYVGARFRPVNIGKIQNKGFDVSLIQRLINTNDFHWDISALISNVTNEVIDMNDEVLITDFEGGQFVTREGSPVNSFYGYQFEGVYGTYDNAKEAGLVNKKEIPYGAGDAIYSDFSGPGNQPDGKINNYDKVILGSPVPDYFGSFSNQLRYKRWTFDFMIQFVYGHELFNYVRYMNERMVDLSNQSKSTLNRWQQNGDQTDIPRALFGDPIGNADFSSRWIEDGSYVQLKNIGLRYVVPNKFLLFRNASFFITATNVITLDNYLGYDPRFSYSFSPMRQGIDYGLMPQFRKILIGFNLGL